MITLCDECGKPAEYVRTTAFSDYAFCREHAEAEADFMKDAGGSTWQVIPPSDEAKEYERLRQEAENKSIADLLPPMDADMPNINPDTNVVEATLKYMGQSIRKQPAKSGELLDERKKILSDVWMQVYCASVRSRGNYPDTEADRAMRQFEERFLD